MPGCQRMPIFGVGPGCVASMMGIFAIGIASLRLGFLDTGFIDALRMPCAIIGSLLILSAVWIWIQAVIIERVDHAVRENRLITTGIYSWVRNPIYTAIAIALTGLAALFANAWLAILPFLFWIDITIWMKATEEKWLKEEFGPEYIAYCRRVNRCIPKPPRKTP